MDDIDLSRIGISKSSLFNALMSDLEEGEFDKTATGWFERKVGVDGQAHVATKQGSQDKQIQAFAYGVFVPTTAKAALEASDQQKHNFYRYNDQNFIGVIDDIENIFENALFQQDDHFISAADWMEDREIIPIKAELWVSVINNVALQILEIKSKDQDEEVDEAQNNSPTQHARARQVSPDYLKEKDITDQSKNKDAVAKNILRVNRLPIVVNFGSMKQRQHEAEETKKEIAERVQDEKRELDRDSKGLSGTPVHKEKAEETAIKKIKHAETPLSNKLRDDRSPTTDHIDS